MKTTRCLPNEISLGFIVILIAASLCGCGVTNIKGNLVWQDPSGKSVPLSPDRCEGQNGWLDLSSTKTGSRIHYITNAWDGPEVQITAGNSAQTNDFRKADCSVLNLDARQDAYSWQMCDGPPHATYNCKPIGGDIHGSIELDCSAQNGVRVKGRIDAVNCTESKNNPNTLTPENLARIQGTDVVHLQSHYAPPAIPDSLKGVRVFVSATFVSEASASQNGAGLDSVCTDKVTNMFGQMGWRPVRSESDPHDLVARGFCTQISFVTSDNQTYALLPAPLGKLRLETLDGKPLWEQQPLSTTYQCPGDGLVDCAEAVKEYRDAQAMSQIVQSAQVADWARQANRR